MVLGNSVRKENDDSTAEALNPGPAFQMMEECDAFKVPSRHGGFLSGNLRNGRQHGAIDVPV